VTLQERIFEALDGDNDSSVDRVVGIGLLVLIVANVVAVTLETVESLRVAYGGAFTAFEVFSVGVFSLEYVLRVWSSPANPHARGGITARVRFVFTPLALIDLAAILPAYLPMFIPMDLRFLRAVRLLRLMRALKIARYSRALRTLVEVVRGKKDELFVTGLAGMILLMLASSAMYLVEHEAQPAVFSSIPAAMWWGVVTLTTVGYGDIYPITPLGKVLGAFIGIIGIGLFALPAGILAGGFAETLQRRKVVCPHCGKQMD
jgi:voltage-gated potassium channel